jgi:cyclophilin family peptidyl-prolyl cis-trans isomerase
MRITFFVMAAALVVGAFATCFTTGLGGDNDNPAGFVRPPDDDNDDDGTPDPANDEVEIKQYAAAPPMTVDPTRTYLATLQTEAGEIQIELDPQVAPESVNSFVFLARDGFYDGLIFHYVDPGFSANAGDPTCTADDSACRGTGDPGFDVAEVVEGEFGDGTVGMANASQFFIALQASDQFAGFTPIGRVVSGLEVAHGLTRGVQIQSVTIEDS